MGLKVRGSVLKESIRQLQEDELEPGVVQKMDSKHIDKVDIRFRGAGIKEQDEYGEIIQRRVVRLLRYEVAEGFQP